MPNRDGKGPEGKGPMTGREAGKCSGDEQPRFGFGRGLGRRGKGHGQGRGVGRRLFDRKTKDESDK